MAVHCEILWMEGVLSVVYEHSCFGMAACAKVQNCLWMVFFFSVALP